MTAEYVIVEDMARKQSRKQGRPAGRQPTVTVFARIDPALARVFSDYVDSLRPKTSTKAVVEMLIEEHLKSAGLWPPPSSPPTESES